MEMLGNCPVCFEDLKDKETASPDVCDHIFCLFCLQKWAKLGGSFCPVDRKRFRKIIDLSTSASIQIKPRKRKKCRELYDVSVHCEVCSKTDNNDTLILCDCCDLGYHCKCLTPPLKRIPPGIWNCPVCVSVTEKIKSRKGITKEVKIVAMNQTNCNMYSSDSNNSFDSPQEQNNCKKFSRNIHGSESNISVNSSARNFISSEASDVPSSSTSQPCHRRSKKLKSPRKDISRLKNLRPRNCSTKYCIHSYSSSESNTSLESFERNNSKNSTPVEVETKLSCTLRSRFKEKNQGSKHYFRLCSSSEEDCLQKDHGKDHNSSKNWLGRRALKRWCLRSQELAKKRRRENSSDSNSSDNSSVTEQKNESSHENFKDSLSRRNFNFIQSKTLNVPTGENVNNIEVTEITIDSSDESEEIMTENFSENKSNNKSECKKEFNYNKFSSDSSAIPSTPLTLSSQAIQENEMEECSQEMCLPFISEVHHAKDLQMYKEDKLLKKTSLTNSELLLSDDTFNELSLGSSDVVLNKYEKIEVPVFSVFDKYEDTSVSQEKYSIFNLAVTKDLHNFKNKTQNINNCPNIKDTPSSGDSTQDQNSKDISEELRKIEKEKWKTFQLQKNHKDSSSISGCSTFERNNSLCDTVEVGKYCQKQKYSDNYNRFLAITKSLRRKTKYDSKASVILPSLDILKLVNRNKQRTKANSSCFQKFYSDNYTSLSNENSVLNPGLDAQEEKHQSIPIKTKDFHHFQETESELLGSVICLNDINQLSVRNDGTLFVDWHNS